MSRLEAVITCVDCKRELARVEATEIRPGIWSNTPSVELTKECPHCKGSLIRAEHAEKYEVHKADFTRAKEFSKPKPGRAI